MDFARFTTMFEGHINGTAKNEREAHESAEEDGGDAKKSARQATSKKGASDAMNRTSSHNIGDAES